MSCITDLFGTGCKSFYLIAILYPRWNGMLVDSSNLMVDLEHGNVSLRRHGQQIHGGHFR